MKRVFDVDGVICNFVDGMLNFCDERGYETDFCCWKDVDRYNFFPDGTWEQIRHDPLFWLGLKRMPQVRRLMLEYGIWPDLYLTARPIASEVTAKWLHENQLPTAKVVTVDHPLQKLQYLSRGDVLVDDHVLTIRAAQEMGVTALLMSAPFHRGIDPSELANLTVIHSLAQVKEFIN